MKKSSVRSLFVILCSITIGLAIYLYFIVPLKNNYNTHHVDIHGVYLLNPIKIEDFKLIDQHGTALTKSDLKNHWSLLFFGFTRCEMVCPVTLGSLNQFYQTVNKKLALKDRPKIIFITIDPENDTLDKLNIYLASFNKNFIGARTSASQTALVKRQFHIQSKNTNEHSSEIVVVNPKAEIQAYFYFPHNPTQLEKDYLAILRQNI